jgi:hypothetical protein
MQRILSPAVGCPYRFMGLLSDFCKHVVEVPAPFLAPVR